MKRFNLFISPFLLLGCLLTSVVSAQVNQRSPYHFSGEIYERVKKDSIYWLGGVASSDLSFIGLYKEARLEYDKPRRGITHIPDADSIAFLAQYKPVSAEKFILQQAATHQVLIFNEAHFNPRNRVLVTSLLARLKKLGYTCLAVEAFANDSSFTKKQHPVVGSTGFYTNEPQFGNMIRTALQLGYTLLPYEAANMGNAQKRELEQAQHIAAFLKKEPGTRLIVYCGFDHVLEDSIPGLGKRMAGRLKELTGIDPYTLDQTTLTEKAFPGWEHPYYRITQPKQYTVLVNQQGIPLNSVTETPGHVDAFVLAPRTNYVYNRPDWVFENNKTPYFLPAATSSFSYPVMVKAYGVNDAAAAVPLDVIEIKSADEIPATAIALPKKGRFVLQLCDSAGHVQKLQVKR